MYDLQYMVDERRWGLIASRACSNDSLLLTIETVHSRITSIYATHVLHMLRMLSNTISDIGHVNGTKGTWTDFGLCMHEVIRLIETDAKWIRGLGV